jgi:uncharacterized protein YndB with AHSA1/START domain
MINGDDVVHEIVLPASAEDAFAMFVDAERLVRWIGISAELEPRPGGRFRFEVIPGQFCEGQYLVVERPRRLVFTWGWTDPAMGVAPGSSQVEVTLTPIAGGRTSTRVLLVHSRLAGDAQPLHDDGWERFLNRLAATSTTGQTTPYPTETPPERRQELRQPNDRR